MKAKTQTAGKTANNPIDIKVKRVHQFDEKHIAFDVILNGINVSGMQYVEYTNKEGKDGYMINFPASKGKDGNYYNIVWCPLDKDARESIKAQIEDLL